MWRYFPDSLVLKNAWEFNSGVSKLIICHSFAKSCFLCFTFTLLYPLAKCVKIRTSLNFLLLQYLICLFYEDSNTHTNTHTHTQNKIEINDWWKYNIVLVKAFDKFLTCSGLNFHPGDEIKLAHTNSPQKSVRSLKISRQRTKKRPNGPWKIWKISISDISIY